MRQLLTLFLILVASALDYLYRRAGAYLAVTALLAGLISAFRLNNPAIATLAASGLITLCLIYLQIRRGN